MRISNATPDDAFQLMNGYGYVVKYGKQVIGYHATARSASIQADQRDANAYKITKNGNQVVLEDIDSAEAPTPAEEIAARISEEITGGVNRPISPMTKQRSVMLMRSAEIQSELAFEAFLIIYPSSNQDQFNRMWASVPVKNQETDDRQRFMDYAMTKGVEPIIESVFTGKFDECAKRAMEIGLSTTTFSELMDKAVEYGVIDSNKSKEVTSTVSKLLTRKLLERSTGDDIFQIINSDDLIKRMAESGNVDGIADRLTGVRGIDSDYANEIAREVISSYSLLKSLSSERRK